ncbi:heme exporter protein CcmB [Glaciecola sp. HTCC2999]|jgi:heme exporter protein B|uniref:heme exporter protein CcmB n=1 Tax=Glaciecola sp. HTCC2999 TaxID=455436 RepID=UPI0000E0E62D|nr:heme exporter protein CcmB [Glaciecola sp. HTCC2999]
MNTVSPIMSVMKRDLLLAFRQKAELLQPLLFFVMVITLFPLGIGPGPDTLQKIGPGVIWVAAILSSLLGMDKLFRDDFNDGSLEQLQLSNISLSWGMFVKVLVHWCVSFLPLLFISPLLALFLNLTTPMYWSLVFTLVLGTPLLSLVGAIAVALTVGLQRGGVLLSLLLLPVFIPLLIFATSAVESAALGLNYLPQIAIIGAMLCFAIAITPFAISYAIRVSHH